MQGNSKLHEDGQGTNLALIPSNVYALNGVNYATSNLYYSRITAYDDRGQTIAYNQNPTIEMGDTVLAPRQESDMDQELAEGELNTYPDISDNVLESDEGELIFFENDEDKEHYDDNLLNPGFTTMDAMGVHSTVKILEQKKTTNVYGRDMKNVYISANKVTYSQKFSFTLTPTIIIKGQSVRFSASWSSTVSGQWDNPKNYNVVPAMYYTRTTYYSQVKEYSNATGRMTRMYYTRSVKVSDRAINLRKQGSKAKWK